MNKFPKISIVTPNFNGNIFLEKCILSVLNQNYPNLEYIVIDGGSTDGSVEVIKKYSDRLTYWVSEPDKGLYHALRKGFEKATGDILGWINADDILLPNSLFSIGGLFSKFPQINWFCGAPSIIDKNNRLVKIYEAKKASKYHLFLRNFNKVYLQQESTYWRKSLLEKCGNINESYKYAGDFSLWMNFFRYEKLYTGNLPIGAFRSHSNSQISKKFKNEYDKEVEEILNYEYQLLYSEEVSVLKKLKRLYRLKKHLSRITIWSLNERIYDLHNFAPKVSYENFEFILVEKRDYCKDI